MIVQEHVTTNGINFLCVCAEENDRKIIKLKNNYIIYRVMLFEQPFLTITCLTTKLYKEI